MNFERAHNRWLDPLMEGGTEYDLEHLKIKAVELASASMSFIDYIRNGDNKRALGQMLVLEALASDIMNENY